MPRCIALLLLVMVGCTRSEPSRPAPPAVAFTMDGESQKSLEVAELRKSVASVDITVFDPHVECEVAFVAFPTAEVLDFAYANAWRAGDAITVSCLDTYAVSIPVERIAGQQSWLAYGYQDGRVFTIKNRMRDGVRSSLGPLYLIWDEFSPATPQPYQTAHWPFQAVSFDLKTIRAAGG